VPPGCAAAPPGAVKALTAELVGSLGARIARDFPNSFLQVFQVGLKKQWFGSVVRFKDKEALFLSGQQQGSD
jgi:hypothetical protein